MRWYTKTDLQYFGAVKRAIADMIAVKMTRGHSNHFDWFESHNEQWLR